VQLDLLDLSEGGRPHGVDPYDVSLNGDVTSRFAPVTLGF
jgi:choloylglycine hydrolase